MRSPTEALERAERELRAAARALRQAEAMFTAIGAAIDAGTPVAAGSLADIGFEITCTYSERAESEVEWITEARHGA
ncbi:hypothetical protein PMO31116_03595 [Pandoraea morbifera]|uniref:Uncharacterized protein n=1 Tax=Pandoraea morbifera TaxID=2508300 RepID=A0A5E4X334_9BURK|nr:hypothetical protein [Pandoraea morbifera]VVE30717.1 hypothetical protein PMO31116_03595 [Pandoraea morbifera]